MHNQFLDYENYETDKTFMQTFGRGTLPKFVEPKLSERNAFQQEKIIREKYAKRRENQSRGKQRVGNAQQRHFYDQQRSQLNQGRDLGYYRAKGQFEDIDNINDKINGLIKSISMSCQKKDSLPLKSNKIQKCDTNQKLPKKDIDLKREKLLESAVARKACVTGFDSFGTKQEANWFKQQKRQIKTYNYESKNERSSTQFYQNNKQDERRTIKREQQDQIQQRIKKIQDKISVYEQKMGYLQPDNQFKKDHIEKTVEKQGLRQMKDYSNNKNQLGSRLVQKQRQIPKKQERTAKKETSNAFERQSNRKSYKENISGSLYYEKQNKKQQRMFEGLQIKSKNYPVDKSKDMQSNKKNTAEKQQNHSRTHMQKKVKGYSHTQKIQKVQSTQLQSSKALKMHQKSTFIKAILKQIQFDQDFRHAKHMFGGIQGLFDQNYQSDKEKWIKLREQLKKQGFTLSINQVKQIFMPRDDQIDPFMSVSHSHDELIHGVIFAYQTAQKHWNDHIYRSWTLWQLKQSNFTSQSLDRGKKGYISLQDLTFYINTQVDGNYRNRDLLLIFNRLGQNSLKKAEHTLPFKVIIDRLLSL